MKFKTAWFSSLFREWLLIASIVGLVATSFQVKRFPTLSVPEIQLVFLLWVLFVSAKGLENSNLILRLAQVIESGRLVSLKLVAITFVLSMVITNDIALVVIVPLTLSLNTTRKDILVILEALAANAGSALTPFGNPQNLFIYWFYHIHPVDLIAEIAPFSIFFLALLLAVSMTVGTTSGSVPQVKKIMVKQTAYVFGILLLVVDLTVFRIFTVPFSALVPVCAFMFDRKSLRVDYGLLFTFLCFIGAAENIRVLLASNLEHSGHIFIFSALSSQIISNVPTALLFAKFTTQWKALLWGTNVGGYGNIVSSFANLIAYKFYINYVNKREIVSFTIKFTGLGYVMFVIGSGLYFAMKVWL